METEFGRKTQVHQASCNKDYSCLEGDCPSFLTGRARRAGAARGPRDRPPRPEPRRLVSDADFGARMMGIGGTGVVTVNQVLAMSALIDGLHVSGLDQTGLSQKSGPVTSDLRISSEPLAAASKAPAGSVDLYLGFDLLGAASDANLMTADGDRTVAVVSTRARAHRPHGRRHGRALPGPSRHSSSGSTPPPGASTISTSTHRRSRSGCSAIT